MSEKDHLFEMKKSQISTYLFFVLCSLEIACSLQDKRYAIKKIKRSYGFFFVEQIIFHTVDPFCL